MEDNVQITLAPLKRAVVPVAIGVTISFLVITSVGTVLGMALWPAIISVYHRANRALGAATYLVNLVTVVLAFAFISWLSIVGDRSRTETSIARVLRQNGHFLLIAKLVTVVAFFEVHLTFIRQEASNFVVIQIGNVTQLDFLSTTWAIALGFVLPVALLILLLIGAARLSGQ